METQSHAREAAADARKFLSFQIDGEPFALAIDGIKEIIEYINVTRVPLAPRFIRGVTNLRGSVVPVVDLGVRLGRAPARVDRRTCIVIAEVAVGDEALDIGVIVDGVNSVLDIAEWEIEPAPEFGADVPRDFIAGMGRRDGGFMVLLDPQRTLSVEELSQFEGAVG